MLINSISSCMKHILTPWFLQPDKEYKKSFNYSEPIESVSLLSSANGSSIPTSQTFETPQSSSLMSSWKPSYREKPTLGNYPRYSETYYESQENMNNPMEHNIVNVLENLENQVDSFDKKFNQK